MDKSGLDQLYECSLALDLLEVQDVAAPLRSQFESQ